MMSNTPAQRDIILFLSTSGLSVHQIASKTGLGKSTIARVVKESLPDEANIKKGCPPKLTPTDKRAVAYHIISGKADNAVQAAHFISTIINNTVSTQTIRNTLKSGQLKAVMKKKKTSTICQSQEEEVSLCTEVPTLDCGGLDMCYLVR